VTTDLYRAFWRWHFYAGLLALPFLAWLAVTGGLYLFKPEIERAVYGSWITLAAPRDALPPSRLIAAAERQSGGQVTQVELPASGAESWRLRVQVGDQARTAFVDPGTGAVLGTAAAAGVMKTVRDLHSLAITGPLGNALIEIAAGWAIVLVVTGVILWWPRGRNPALALRGPPRKRRFWRDLHAGTGILAGALILFLAVTGMPWSMFWGAQAQQLVDSKGLGRPAPPGSSWAGQAGSIAEGHDHGVAAQRDSLPWAMQASALPAVRAGTDIGVDRAAALARSHGMDAPMIIGLPGESGRPYSFSRVNQRAEDARVLYLEPSSGRVLQDAPFSRFGGGAQVIEWGIATHQGEEYGSANRWIMLAGCLALMLLCVSAPVLWWKRRVKGKVALPPLPRDSRSGVVATVAAGLIGLLYPLTGCTMLVALLVDRALVGRSRRQMVTQ